MTWKNLLYRYLLVLLCAAYQTISWSQDPMALGTEALNSQQYEAAAIQFEAARNEAISKNDSFLKVSASKYLANVLLFINEMDSAFHLVNKTIPLAGEIGDTISLIELINWKSEFLNMKGRYSERIKAYEPILRHLENYESGGELGHDKLYAELFVAFGSIIFAEDRTQSISYINKSIELSTKINDTPKIAYAQNVLASIYLGENNLAKAISAGIEASKYTEDNSPTFQASVYLNIGKCLVEIGNIEKAKNYLQLAEKHSIKYNLNRRLAAINLAYARLYYTTGQNELFTEKLKEAKKYWLPKYGKRFLAQSKSIQLKYFIKNNLRDSVLNNIEVIEHLSALEIDPYTKNNLISSLSNAYLYLGRREKAFRTYQNFAQDSSSFFHSGDSLHYFSFLVRYYEQKNDTPRHLEYLKKKRKLIDKRKEQNRISNIYLLEDEYQQANKERQIAKLETKISIKSLELDNRNKLLGILSGFVLILGFLGFYILKRNQKIKDQNKTIKENEASNKLLLSEIHGRVKESLQTISSLLHMQARDLKNEDAKLAIMEGRNRINSMALIHDHLFLENNQDKIQIKDYFDQLLEYILNSYSTPEREIFLKKEINIDKMPLEQVSAIGLIVNELVSNSLKHAFVGKTHGSLKVGFNETNSHYALSIADDGIGIDPNSERIESGFGSKIIQAFAKKLKATLKRVDNAGTTTILEFPKSI